jgi:surface carbohydrate biosynthesis protein (TIGR04326 family)
VRKTIQNPSRPVVLFRSWVTRGNFETGGVYRERNFGSLHDTVRERGFESWILPLFFNLERSLWNELRELNKSSQKFLLMEDVLRPIDYIRTFLKGFLVYFISFPKIDWNILSSKTQLFTSIGLDSLIQESHRRTSIGVMLQNFEMAGAFFSRLKSRGVSLHKVIYPMEGNAPEKSLVLAARDSYPNAEIIGFQHSSWYRENLASYIGKAERAIHPTPDRVICTGSRYLSIFEECGYPSDKLSLGPSLRFAAAVHRGEVRKFSRIQSLKEVVIVLNFNSNQSLELLYKAGKALQIYKNASPDRDFKIRIKIHPVLAVEEVKEFLVRANFPHYEWETRTVIEAARSADVVFMTAGSISNLEVISTGSPLLRISLDLEFNLDPLWDNYPLGNFVRNTEEILEKLKFLENSDSSFWNDFETFAQKIRREYFEPITNENIEVFI